VGKKGDRALLAVSALYRSHVRFLLPSIMSAREDDILSVMMVDEEKDGHRGEEAYDDVA